MLICDCGRITTYAGWQVWRALRPPPGKNALHRALTVIRAVRHGASV